MITEGWYIPQREDRVDSSKVFPRWVLGEIGGKVCYSRGGDAHHYCLARTFINWMKRTNAKLQRRPAQPQEPKHE